MLLELYYNKKQLSIVGVEYEGVKHFTADVRSFSPYELSFVLSKKTIADNLFNDTTLKEGVNTGYYELRKVETKANIEHSFVLTYFDISPQLKTIE